MFHTSARWRRSGPLRIPLRSYLLFLPGSTSRNLHRLSSLTAAGQTPETSKLFIIASLEAGFPTTGTTFSELFTVYSASTLSKTPSNGSAGHFTGSQIGHVPQSNLPHLPRPTLQTPQNFATSSSSTSGKGSKLSPRDDVPSRSSPDPASKRNTPGGSTDCPRTHAP